MYLAYLILEVFCRQSYMINGIGSKLCFCKEEMKTIDLELKHEAYMSVAEKKTFVRHKNAHNTCKKKTAECLPCLCVPENPLVIPFRFRKYRFMIASL